MRVAVVGGGPTGLTAALALAQQPDIEVDLFERFNDPHPGLWVLFGHTAVSVAEELGFWDELRAIFVEHGCRPISQYVFVDGTQVSLEQLHGSLVRCNHMADRYGRDVGWMIRRAPVLAFLEKRVKASDKIRVINSVCTGVDGEKGFLDCGGKQEGPYDLIVGADGTFSTLRKYVVPDFQLVEQDIALQGISHLPSAEAQKFNSQPFSKHFVVTLHDSTPFVSGSINDTSQVWMMSLAPNLIDSLLSSEGQPSGTWQGSKRLSAERWLSVLLAEVKHPLLHEMVKATSPEEFRSFRVRLSNPLPSVCFRHRVVLLGDAMHPLSPNTGWGLSLGMADSLALARLFKSKLPSVGLSSTLEQFDRQQRPIWNAFVQQSLVAANHFGKGHLFLDRLVLTLLPPKLLFENFDKLCPPVVEGLTIRPLWNRYVALASAVALCFVSLTVNVLKRRVVS